LTTTPRPASVRTAALFRARDALAATRSPAAAARAVLAVADDAWAALRPQVVQQGALACRAGCAACCHQRVAVLPAEADLIAEHVRVHDPGRLARLAAPRGAHDPCPFLDPGDAFGVQRGSAGGTCSIYALRPLRCRGLHSRDAAACRKWLDGLQPVGADLTAFALEPIGLMDAALAGLGQALGEAGADTATLELAPAVASRLARREETVASPGKTPIFPA
jgi:hypothetical protein